jgi:hypothetical protein
LHEALGLAVCSGGKGLDAQVTDSQLLAGIVEEMGAVGGAVINHDAFHANAALAEVLDDRDLAIQS